MPVSSLAALSVLVGCASETTPPPSLPGVNVNDYITSCIDSVAGMAPYRKDTFATDPAIESSLESVTESVSSQYTAAVQDQSTCTGKIYYAPDYEFAWQIFTPGDVTAVSVSAPHRDTLPSGSVRCVTANLLTESIYNVEGGRPGWVLNSSEEEVVGPYSERAEEVFAGYYPAQATQPDAHFYGASQYTKAEGSEDWALGSLTYYMSDGDDDSSYVIDDENYILAEAWENMDDVIALQNENAEWATQNDESGANISFIYDCETGEPMEQRSRFQKT